MTTCSMCDSDDTCATVEKSCLTSARPGNRLCLTCVLLLQDTHSGTAIMDSSKRPESVASPERRPAILVQRHCADCNTEPARLYVSGRDKKMRCLPCLIAANKAA